LLNKAPFLANECVILLEEDKIASPISCVFYNFYDDINILKEELESRSSEIQLIASHTTIPGLKTIKPGQAQEPAIDQYADNVDTISFLCTL
jgi:hypothetical protein